MVFNFFKAKSFLFILLPALLFGISYNVKADDSAMVIQAIGTGIIRGKDVAAARDEALSNAMVSSVQWAVADLVPMETIVSNFKKLDESIFENIGDYILAYKILAESTSGKTYRIMLEATLFSEKIREMIFTLDTVETDTEMDLPKVLFFLAEQNVGDILPFYWWGEDPAFIKGYSEKTLENALVEQGFHIIEHEGMLLYQPDKAYINNPYLSNEEAIELGYLLKADIIVVGTAIAEMIPSTIGLNTRSVRADLSIRAILVDTGKEIAFVDQQSVTVSEDSESGGRDALSNVGTIAGKTLATRITQGWKDFETTFGQIEIFVKGTGDLGSFVSFRKSLSQIPGINNIRIKETMTDDALLLVNYTGSIQTLAETLVQKSYENFGVNVFEVGRKHISMNLIPGKISRSR
jgi:hypothetical protein